jgi:hypothetical protein
MVFARCNDGECPFKKVSRWFLQQLSAAFVFSMRLPWRWNMRKLSYVLAALATIALPTIASAEGFGVYIGGDRDYYGDRYYGPRAEFYGHPGWHRGWYHRDYDDRGVVIRRHYWNEY